MLASLAFLLVTTPPLPGDTLAPFTLERRDGLSVEWRPGRTTVITVCAFWCDTWKTQLPRVEAAQNRLRGLPIDFMTVSVDGRWSDVTQQDALLDRGRSWSGAVGINQVPTTLVIDATGRVALASSGTFRSEDIVRACLLPPRPAGDVFLTFDDFPSREGSDLLLDALRALDAPATLFCIGKNAEATPDLVRRAVHEGHQIAMHSWSHEAGDPQLGRCQKLLVELTHQTKFAYRAPGSERIEVSGRLRQGPVIDPFDYLRPGKEEVIRRVVRQAKPNAVIQLHAGVRDTIEALPEIVRRLRAMGYRFQVLP